MIALVLCLTVGNQNKSFSALLAMMVCTMVLLLGLRYLEPVAEFIRELEAMGKFSGETVKILLKTALIGMITEIAALLCADGGSTSLGQVLRFVGSFTILWLSLPLFRGLIELIQKILEGI